MTTSVGPIEFQFIESFSWTDGRSITTTAIPLRRNQSYTVGTNETTYTLSTSFFALTDEAAKVKRRQLHELARNPNIDFVYINFEQDSHEHSGWYHISDVSTTPITGTFGDYPVTFNITRRGTTGSHLLGTYRTANPLVNNYNLTGQNIMTLPNGATNVQLSSRGGANGDNRITVNRPELYLSYPLPLFSGLYECRCRIQDTILADSTTEAEWADVFGPEHVFQGDHIYGNGQIRFRWYSSSQETTIEIFDTGLGDWLEVASNYRINSGGGSFPAGRPITIGFSWDLVEWHIKYETRIDNRLTIKYSLSRGQYFIKTEIVSNDNGIDVGSALVTASGATITQVENSGGSAAPGVGLPVDSAFNYAAAQLDNGVLYRVSVR